MKTKLLTICLILFSFTAQSNDLKTCKNVANYFNEKLKSKGIILRSTEDGYKIKNMLRLSIGSIKDNLRFMSVVKSIFDK